MQLSPLVPLLGNSSSDVAVSYYPSQPRDGTQHLIEQGANQQFDIETTAPGTGGFAVVYTVLRIDD